MVEHPHKIAHKPVGPGQASLEGVLQWQFSKHWQMIHFSRKHSLSVLLLVVLLRSDGHHGYEWAKIGDFINLTFYLTRGNAENSVLKLKFILFYFNLMIFGVFCGI